VGKASKKINNYNATSERKDSFQEGKICYNYIKTKRSAGYKYKHALGDLIDNSLDAEADKVDLFFIKKNDTIEEFHIVDDGCSMDYETLKGSYNLGHDRPRGKHELGKFGVGGTEGCLSLCRTKISLSKEKGGKLLCRYYSLDLCQEEDAWGSISRNPTKEEEELWKSYLGNKEQGTVIILKDLDLLISKRPGNVRPLLLREFGEMYGNFLRSGKEITVDGQKVIAYDPIRWNSEGTIQEYGPQPIDGYPEINLRVADVLQTKDEKATYRKQGGYILRCGRMIQSALTNGDTLEGFWDMDPHSRGVRWQLDYNGVSDEVMGTSSKKDSVNIEQPLMDKIREIVVPLKKKCVKREASLATSTTKSDDAKLIARAEAVASLPMVTGKMAKKTREKNVTSIGSSILPILPIQKGTTTTAKIKNLTSSIGFFEGGREGALGTAKIVDVSECKYSLKLNKDHPYIIKNYLEASGEVKKATLVWVLAFLITNLELSEDSQDSSCLDDWNRIFLQKLAVFTREM